MFNLDDRVVYPGHGVASITRIIKRIVGGKVTTFYELKFIHKDMTILVPISSHSQSGIRPLVSKEKINDLFEFLAQPEKKAVYHEGTLGNWKQRNKEYQTKLRTGDLKEISKIYRELKHIGRHKELSFCEKNLLLQTETLLAEEIALVKKFAEEKAIEHLRSFFNNLPLTNRTTMTQKTV